MPKKKRDPEIIILEQDGQSGFKWMLVGSLLGAALALLLAPATGEETRQELLRRGRKLKLSAEDAVDEIQERFDAFRSGEDDDLEDEVDDEDDDEDDTEEEEDAEEPVELSRSRRGRRRKSGSDISEAREELERRLEAARSKRRESGALSGEQDA
jgi:gas vesicle protein